jgi:hypothetical protein
MVKSQIVPQDESSSESCLHCKINDLVQEHIEGQEKVDIVALATNMAESLVDFVLLAPEEEQAKLLAVTIAHLGHVFLEKSGRLKETRIRRTDTVSGSARPRPTPRPR